MGRERDLTLVDLVKIAGMEKKAYGEEDFVDNVEDLIGLRLGKKQEEFAKALYEKAVNSRFAMRHPILTGIPTLGLAPTISRESAEEKAKTKILREFPDLASAVSAAHEKRKAEEAVEREVRHKREMEHLEATKAQRALATGALGATMLAGEVMRNLPKNEEKKEAGVVSEGVGSLVWGPLSLPGIAVGALMKRQSEEELREQDKAMISNLLPILGGYRLGRRLKSKLSANEAESVNAPATGPEGA